MSRADDLVQLFTPPSLDQLGFRQGLVVSFDLSNGQNVIDVGGTQLVNVPLLNVTDSVSLQAGDIVALLTWRSSWWIIGRVILPNSPGYGSFCVFENNGEGVCITQNGIDIYPPNPPDDVARIFAQHFADGRMWLEFIPPRTAGGSGDNRIIVEGHTLDAEGGTLTPGSISLITGGSMVVDVGDTLFLDTVNNIQGHTDSDLFWTADGQVVMGSSLPAGGNVFIDSGNQLTLNSDIDQVFISHPTDGVAANCQLDSNGLIKRVTSARKYKTDIADAQFNTQDVLSLRPRIWRNKKEVESNPETTNWNVGLIAEEVEQAGLGIFVNYDEDGEPDSLVYDRIVVALLDVVKEQNRRIASLEKRLESLDGVIASDPSIKTTQKPKRRLDSDERIPRVHQQERSHAGPLRTRNA